MIGHAVVGKVINDRVVLDYNYYKCDHINGYIFRRLQGFRSDNCITASRADPYPSSEHRSGHFDNFL